MDSQHTEGELAMAAVCYASPELVYCKSELQDGFQWSDLWPGRWDEEWDKRKRYQDGEGGIVPNNKLNKSARIRNLVKAGALIAAEIDRLQSGGQ